MCGDEGGRVGQFVVPPHPEGEEDDGDQADDGNQRVEQGAEELRLLGKRVGGGCVGTETGTCYACFKATEYHKLWERGRETGCVIGLTLCYIISNSAHGLLPLWLRDQIEPRTHTRNRISESIP